MDRVELIFLDRLSLREQVESVQHAEQRRLATVHDLVCASM